MSLTPIGLIGLALSFAAIPLSSVRLTPARVLICLALIVFHIASCVAYFAYIQNVNTDARLYYFDRIGVAHWDFQFGTVALAKMVQAMRSYIGGSFFDYFLIFQSFGLLGIAILMRVLEEISESLRAPVPKLTYVLLFFPGVHFWTSMIGKDAPLFLAVSLATWSVLKLGRRMPILIAALGIMVLFRPHIALITVICIALAATFGRGLGTAAKAVLVAIAAGGASVIASTVKQSSLQVDVTDANAVADWLSRHGSVSQTIEGETAVQGASYAFKLLSLLFRPFFVDATGPLALIASMENLFLFLMIAFLIWNVRELAHLVSRVFFLRFVLLFALTTTLLLALVYYNVGLGLRQKNMMMPALFSLFAALWTFRGVRRAGQPAPPQDYALPEPPTLDAPRPKALG